MWPFSTLENVAELTSASNAAARTPRLPRLAASSRPKSSMVKDILSPQ
jgi:hypothetical protein